jgi:hypothetical protein
MNDLSCRVAHAHAGERRQRGEQRLPKPLLFKSGTRRTHGARSEARRQRDEERFGVPTAVASGRRARGKVLAADYGPAHHRNH